MWGKSFTEKGQAKVEQQAETVCWKPSGKDWYEVDQIRDAKQNGQTRGYKQKEPEPLRPHQDYEHKSKGKTLYESGGLLLSSRVWNGREHTHQAGSQKRSHRHWQYVCWPIAIDIEAQTKDI